MKATIECNIADVEEAHTFACALYGQELWGYCLDLVRDVRDLQKHEHKAASWDLFAAIINDHLGETLAKMEP